MRMSRLTHPFLAASLSLALAACASGGGGGEAAEEGAAPSADEVSIQVTNDINPPSQVTIFVAPQSGARRRLGTIAPGGQGSWNFQPRVRSMEHTLVAEGGENRSSDPFVLTGATGVRWTVSNRVAQVVR